MTMRNPQFKQTYSEIASNTHSRAVSLTIISQRPQFAIQSIPNNAIPIKSAFNNYFGEKKSMAQPTFNKKSVQNRQSLMIQDSENDRDVAFNDSPINKFQKDNYFSHQQQQATVKKSNQSISRSRNKINVSSKFNNGEGVNQNNHQSVIVNQYSFQDEKINDNRDFRLVMDENTVKKSQKYGILQRKSSYQRTQAQIGRISKQILHQSAIGPSKDQRQSLKFSKDSENKNSMDRSAVGKTITFAESKKQEQRYSKNLQKPIINKLILSECPEMLIQHPNNGQNRDKNNVDVDIGLQRVFAILNQKNQRNK